MEYNTQKRKLILPEYGRSIQNMIDHALTIEDKEKRTKAAYAIIDVMGNLYPHLRDVEEFRHKLWDHLAIMSNFSMNIETPYPMPSMEKLNAKPDQIPYAKTKIRYKYYGRIVERLLEEIKTIKNEEERNTLLSQTANYMKKAYMANNHASVEDKQIIHDLKEMCGNTVELPEDFSLEYVKSNVHSQRRNNNSNPRNFSRQKEYKNLKKQFYIAKRGK